MRWLQTTTAPSIGTTFDHRTQRGAAAGGRAESPYIYRAVTVECLECGAAAAAAGGRRRHTHLKLKRTMITTMPAVRFEIK
jgi:hypothetical protein